MDPRTDEEFVALANGGDVAGFEGLYRRHREWVVSVAWRFTGSRDEALDVAQDAFIWLMKQFPGFGLRAKMRTVLYPVIRSIALTGKRRKRARDIHLPALLHLARGEANVIEGETERIERQRALARALDALSDDHREVILMRFVDEMSLEEIAHALAIPVGTVKSRVHHAARSLRDSENENP